MNEPAQPAYAPGSYRDRTARVVFRDHSVYRVLSEPALADWQALAGTRFFQQYSSDGRLVATERAPDELEVLREVPGWVAALRHAAIPFVSYPYEWPFGMLRDAALLQLDLLLGALEEGLVLKDGTPYNVQWQGASPVYIDTASITRYQFGDAWAGYRQFCNLCLYPLMLQAYRDVPFQPWLRGSLEGIAAEACLALMSRRDLLRPGVLTHVYLQAKAEARTSATTRDVKRELQRAGFNRDLIVANARRLRRLVSGLAWTRRESVWSEYADQNTYQREEAEQKAVFVKTAATERPRALVWDLGSNTGRFSRIVADHAHYVVALDADELSVERMYQQMKADGVRNVLPLIGNVASPSPALGWRHRERLRIEDRGRPDLVLCLALIHHVVLGANVRLDEFVDWLAGLGAELVIEFVGRDDSMVQALLRRKDDHFTDYDPAVFEACLGRSFETLRRQTLAGGTRTLYHARPLGRR